MLDSARDSITPTTRNRRSPIITDSPVGSRGRPSFFWSLSLIRQRGWPCSLSMWVNRRPGRVWLCAVSRRAGPPPSTFVFGCVLVPRLIARSPRGGGVAACTDGQCPAMPTNSRGSKRPPAPPPARKLEEHKSDLPPHL